MKKQWLVSKDREINSILSNNINTEAAVCTLAVFLEQRKPRKNPQVGKDMPSLGFHQGEEAPECASQGSGLENVLKQRSSVED